ncbi:MAG: TylF/MycF/NovP-related O-methyltransferase [Candidatus Brocadiia bacterium]
MRSVRLVPEWFYGPLQSAGYIYDDYPHSRESGCAFLRGTIARCLEQLAESGVEGDIAELGVAQGCLSRMLHAVAPARKLHLFDTFEGMPDLPSHFATSVEKVAKRIGTKQNIIFHKGVFPVTAREVLACKFAFVFLDFNLYEPTAEALRFFWPRIVPNGYLFCHDLHKLDGVRKAIVRWMDETKRIPVVLGDAAGTAIFQKGA